MTSNKIKCNNCNIVICEVLSYIQYKHDVMDNESLIRMCESAYSDKEIEEAKSLLFESVPKKEAARSKITRRKDGKNKRNLEDIICFFKEVDPEVIPIFVARDLQKLPPVSIDHIDVVSLLKDVTKLRNDLDFVKEKYVTVSQLQEVQLDIEQLKLASKLSDDQFHEYRNNINFRKRGDYVLDSGPFGLSHTINSELEGTLKTAVSNLNGGGGARGVVDDGGIATCDAIDNLHIVSSRSHSRAAVDLHDAVTLAPAVAVTTPVQSPAERMRDQMPTLDDSQTQSQLITTKFQRQVNNLSQHSQRMSMADMLKQKVEWKTEKPSEEWAIVQRKRYRNRFIGLTGKAVSDSESKFKAADIKLPLFISNVSKDVTEKDICDYIHSKTQEKVTLERINMKAERPYNAFKVYVPKHKIDIYLCDSIWPDGIKFRRFVHLSKGILSSQSQSVNGKQV